MSRPRYAPTGFQFSRRGVVAGAATTLTLGLLLCLPVASRAGTSPTDAHQASPAQPAAAAAAPRGQAADWLGELKIDPARISTAQPGNPGAPAPGVGGLLGPAAETGQLGIPAMVLRAYQLAASDLATEQPSCHLPWWILAGIGHTESGHAEGGRLYPDGTTRGRILGPVLDGTLADNAVITDTDHGRYDGDPRYDRAVGPMQFIPSTWANWGADGNHDGKADPNNIYDATLAAGRYLCADGRDLATVPGIEAAVLSYNHSEAYLDTVLAWGRAYRNGASSVGDVNAPVIRDVTKVRPPLSARPPKKPRKITPGASATPSGSAGSSSAGSSSAGSSSAGSSSAPPNSGSSTPTSASATASPSCTSATPSASSTTTASSSSAAAQASAISSADGGSATAGQQAGQVSSGQLSSGQAPSGQAADSSHASSTAAQSSASSTPTARCTP